MDYQSVVMTRERRKQGTLMHYWRTVVSGKENLFLLKQAAILLYAAIGILLTRNTCYATAKTICFQI